MKKKTGSFQQKLLRASTTMQCHLRAQNTGIYKTPACKGFKLRFEVKAFTKKVFNLLRHWLAVASGEKRDCESQKIIMLRRVFDD